MKGRFQISDVLTSTRAGSSTVPLSKARTPSLLGRESGTGMGTASSGVTLVMCAEVSVGSRRLLSTLIRFARRAQRPARTITYGRSRQVVLYCKGIHRVTLAPLGMDHYWFGDLLVRATYLKILTDNLLLLRSSAKTWWILEA